MIQIKMSELLSLSGVKFESSSGWMYGVSFKDEQALYIGQTMGDVRDRIVQHIKSDDALGVCFTHFAETSGDWLFTTWTFAELSYKRKGGELVAQYTSLLDVEREAIKQCLPELNKASNPRVFLQQGKSGMYAVVGITSEVGRWYWEEYSGALLLESTENGDPTCHNGQLISPL